MFYENKHSGKYRICFVNSGDFTKWRNIEYLTQSRDGRVCGAEFRHEDKRPNIKKNIKKKTDFVLRIKSVFFKKFKYFIYRTINCWVATPFWV